MDDKSRNDRGSDGQAGTNPVPGVERYLQSQDSDRELNDLAPVGRFIIDARTTILDVNSRGAILLHSTREKVLGSRLTDFVAASPEDILDICRKGIPGAEERQEREFEIARPDGSAFFASLQGGQTASAGNLAVIFVTDVTRRRAAENAAAESDLKYKEVADQLLEGVFEADASGAVTYANRKALSLLGMGEDDLKKGVKVFDVIAAEDVAVAGERLGRLLKLEDVGAREYLLVRKDGTIFSALVHGNAIVRGGKVVGVRGMLTDISERKHVETSLQESERRYRELAELFASGVFEADTNLTLVYANSKCLSMFGFDENDLKSGVNVFDVIVPTSVDGARSNFARIFKQEDIGPVQIVAKRRDGTTFPGLAHSSAIVREGVVAGIRGVIVDTSELKEREEALKESELRFRTLLKSLHEGIWVLDKDDLTTFVNPLMAEMLGYTEQEMMGKSLRSFGGEKWQKQAADCMSLCRQGVSQQVEGELLRKDGGRVYALLETSPIRDENGNYTGSIAGVQDITERKLAEERLKQTMAELDRSNKDLEQFAYVASHDLREPLRMMTSFSQSLEKRYKDKLDADANDYIHFIVDGAARMQRLIDDILIYSRVTTRGVSFVPVEMENVFQEVLLDLRAATGETKAKITHDLLPVINADPAQMKQVLQNLVANAIKFSKQGEPPVIHVSARKDSKEWVFSVRDNGIGIDPELFGRLFVLFQRLHTQDEYPGAGVGLAVTKKIVQRHGGQVWVESQIGSGSTFYFSIPLKTTREEDARQQTN